jgi:hypothetical protein
METGNVSAIVNRDTAGGQSPGESAARRVNMVDDSIAWFRTQRRLASIGHRQIGARFARDRFERAVGPLRVARPVSGNQMLLGSNDFESSRAK